MTAPRLALCVLACALLPLAGCLDTIAQALLAPESLAVQGLSGSTEALTGTSAADLSASLGSTAQQLDEIIATYPDAINRPELASLRNQLGPTTPAAAPSAPREGTIADDPAFQVPRDHRIALSEAGPAHADRFVLAHPHAARRQMDQLPRPVDPVALDRWDLQPYLINPLSVRVQ